MAYDGGKQLSVTLTEHTSYQWCCHLSHVSPKIQIKSSLRTYLQRNLINMNSVNTKTLITQNSFSSPCLCLLKRFFCSTICLQMLYLICIPSFQAVVKKSYANIDAQQNLYSTASFQMKLFKIQCRFVIRISKLRWDAHRGVDKQSQPN